MRKICIAIALLARIGFAQDSLNPFELAWMNANEGSSYKSLEHPKGIFVMAHLNVFHCPTNDKIVPILNKITSDYLTDSRVQVLELSRDENPEAYRKWVSSTSPNHPLLRDSKGVVWKELPQHSFLGLYVVDCKGVIRTVIDADLTVGSVEEVDANLRDTVEKLRSENCGS